MNDFPENSQPESAWLMRLNRCLPAYHFESYVGRAGMGHLFKARQKSLERDVAVKSLSHDTGGDENFRKAFESVAKAMARLNHPNLISVFDSGHLDDMSYMVMEYVPGGSLHDAAQGMKIDPAEAVRVIRDICSALAFAHENGVIHRDIKPSNIFLTPNAKPKLGGFGPPRPPGSSSGILAGAGTYTAPELCGHPERADHRSDLYAVGAILYELVSGRMPEPADGHPPELAGCPASLLPVCQRAMHPEPGRRYPDANAFNAALQEWQNQQGRKPPQPGKQIRKPAPGPPPRRNCPPPPTSPIAQRPQTTGIFAPPKRPGPPSRITPPPPGGNSKDAGDHWLTRVLLIVGMLCSIPYTLKVLKQYRDEHVTRLPVIQEDQDAPPSGGGENIASRPATEPSDKISHGPKVHHSSARPGGPDNREVPALPSGPHFACFHKLFTSQIRNGPPLFLATTGFHSWRNRHIRRRNRHLTIMGISCEQACE